MGSFLSLAILACPLGMGVMMWMMMRGDRRPARGDAADLEGLRREHERLGAEIERVEHRETAVR